MEMPMSSSDLDASDETAVVEALPRVSFVLGSRVEGSRNIAQAALIGTPEERWRARPSELRADLS